MALMLESTAFRDGDMIPSKHTCDGTNTSPPLQWQGLPPGTTSLALIADDPDAPMGIWVHWILYNIPPTCGGLPEGMPKDSRLPDGTLQGTTSYRTTGYGGPCPPSGTHRYYFALYALDRMLDLKPGATRGEIDNAMRGHVLAETRFMGRYRRQ